MRILIAGAGVAGLTLAALLRRQGKTLVVIDHRPEGADLGYALALWPHGTRVLHALDLHADFVAASEPLRGGMLRTGRGRPIASYEIPQNLRSPGAFAAIARPQFIAMLQHAVGGSDVRTQTSIARLDQQDGGVVAELTDGSVERFDLVIGADGLHSRVRELLFGRIREYDTGWGCYVWWGDSSLTNEGEMCEWWGRGYFLGLYPCQDRVCVIAGAPVRTLRPDAPDGRLARIEALLAPTGVPLDQLIAALPPDDQPLYLWRMADVRSPRWFNGRVVLAGDSAAAFLPTAGVGASMALESAAVLADELSRTDGQHVPHALELYVKRRLRRVISAQRQSRWLARLVFRESRAFIGLRDSLMRFVSFDQLTGPIIKQLSTPI